MAIQEKPDEAKELSLIGKVEMRIALADSDERLQTTLKTYLAPLLLKLASPHAAVRNKIISICGHLNTRIQPEGVKLPVQALVEQFRAHLGVPLIRHFDLLYIHKGVPRLSDTDKAALFPVLIKGIGASGETSPQHASQIMNLVFQLIEHFKLPGRGTEEDNKLRTKLELDDADTTYLASWFGKLILFTPVKVTAGQTLVCPGLTPAEYSFLALQDKQDTWNASAATGLNLSQTKPRIARLLASGIFTDRERLFPAVFASADAAHPVSEAGEDMLKRVIPNTDLEDKAIVSELFAYFFGSKDSGRPKVRGPLRLKIINLLSKSYASTSFISEIVQVVEECFAKPEAETFSLPGLSDQMQIDRPMSQPSRPTGLELTKLRSALFSYINFVARHGSAESLHTIAPKVLGRLRDFVEEQGWPKAPSSTSQQEFTSRGLAYEVIGLLAKAGPASLVVEPDLDILRWLLRSLAEDRSSNTLTVSIEEALSSVLTAFSRSPLRQDIVSALEQLLLAHMRDSARADSDPDSTRRSTRYVSVRFANRCLPFSSVKARAIDLLAIGSGQHDRPEVIEEGQRGLSPYWYRMLNGESASTETLGFPSFAGIMHFLFTELGAVIDEDTPMRDSGIEVPVVLVEQFRKSLPAVFTHALLYARIVLLNELLPASATRSYDTEWERKLTILLENDASIRTQVSAMLQQRLSSSTDTGLYLQVLLRSFLSTLASRERLLPSTSLNEVTDLAVPLCGIMPDAILAETASLHVPLAQSMQANDHALRRNAARAWGLLVSHPAASSDQNTAGQESVQTTVKQLIEKIATNHASASGAMANQVHGCILGLAYYFSRTALREGTSFVSRLKDDVEFKTYMSALTSILLTTNADHDLRAAAFTALAELSLYQVVQPGSFTSTSNEQVAPKQSDKGESGPTSVLRKVLDKIYDIAKTGNEAAALALGKLATILPEPETIGDTTYSASTISSKNTTTSADTDGTNSAASQGTSSSTAALQPVEGPLLPYLASRLHALHEIRTAESHFSVGEALSYLCAGWDSTALSTALDIPGASAPSTCARTSTLDLLLTRTLKDCATTKPSLRKASVIWLLCLVQYCGHLSTVQGRLGECQAAFKRCLVDRDDLVQETASRGLGLVYERGPPALRADLVRDLMASFSDKKSNVGSAGLAGQVGSDTQLFEPGALPTGSGESVSTYKDIMNLASEVGDSSLVYRFMNLAASNAVWSSRAAFGRFGLSSLLSSDDTGVQSYLSQNPKVYVSLYRYRFDPNEGVRRSMNGIWTSLLGNTSSATIIDTHFDAIAEDLLSHILDREWRTRQACCAALADLVQGQPLARYETYLSRIWTACFRVLDDIKESVCTAAASLARTLTGILTRTLEADSANTTSSSAQTMLSHVLPFLLSPSGLDSSAKEVSLFATKSLLDIIKKSSSRALRSFLPDLIERLLGLIGSLEPEAVEYIRLNAAKYNVSEQRIDDMRLSSIRASPIMESIERCLDLLGDAETMAAVHPRIEAAIKSAIALPSKVACGRVLVSLATRHAFLFKPHADPTLRLLERAVQDRNDTVASSYAVAAGYVARGASDAAILRLVRFARKLYFDSECDRDGITPSRSLSSGDILKSLGKHANDRFNALASDILPFVFVGKHDGHDEVRDVFRETWEDNVGGSRAVSLYLGEIMAIVAVYLDSPQWVLKHTVSRAVADATVLVAGMGTLDEAAGAALWPCLEKALAAKTWDGKEAVCEALVKFVAAGGRYWKGRKEVLEAIRKIAIREAKRQNPAYQTKSIPSLGGIAAAGGQELGLLDSVAGTVKPILEQSVKKLREDADAMDVDGDKSKDTSEVQQKVVVGCLKALTSSVNEDAGEDGAVKARAEALLDSVKIVTAAQASNGLAGSKGARNAVGQAALDALSRVEDVRKDSRRSMWAELDRSIDEAVRQAAEIWRA